MGMISTLEMLKMPTMILTATPPYLILTTIYLRTHYQSLWKSHCPHSSALAATHKPVATYMPAVIFLLQPRPYWLMAWLARHKIRKASFFFFVYSLLACDLWRSWRNYVQPSFCPLSAQWRHVASTPFALRPGLSREDMKRTKEKTTRKRERTNEKV